MARSKKSPGQAGQRERRTFSAEFKLEAVRLTYERRASGVTLNQIARDLDVNVSQLRLWRTQLREKQGGSLPDEAETPEQELRRLRREVISLRQEREFAKKVAVYFAKESH